MNILMDELESSYKVNPNQNTQEMQNALVQAP